jgi:hypothetical protein
MNNKRLRRSNVLIGLLGCTYFQIGADNHGTASVPDLSSAHPCFHNHFANGSRLRVRPMRSAEAASFAGTFLLGGPAYVWRAAARVLVRRPYLRTLHATGSGLAVRRGVLDRARASFPLEGRSAFHSLPKRRKVEGGARQYVVKNFRSAHFVFRRTLLNRGCRCRFRLLGENRRFAESSRRPAKMCG